MKTYRLKENGLSLMLLVVLFACAHGATAQSTTAQSATHDGMPVGFTDAGHPFIGKADASVTLEEWSDYLCPYCGRHFRQTLPALLDQYVRTGQLKLVFRDLPIEGLHPTAAYGHVAANCVGVQGAGAYWAMHDALFARQGEWSRLPDPSEFLAGVAKDQGVDMEAYSACIAEGAVSAKVAASAEEGRTLGYNGTPSFRFSAQGEEKTWELIGAHPLARFSRYADPLIAGEEPPEEPKPKPPELPFWAKPEGLAPDPERPGFNMAGDAYKGNPDAAVAVIEFNDFQCPACQKHTLEAQPIIDKELVDTGKLLWVDKQFPLRIHEHAAVAAVAAECAGDQQRYWQMHGLLHADSERWANEDADNALLGLAEELDLDMEKFRGCFESRQGLERVLKDLYDAQGVISRAPTFVILESGRGTTTGPLPADQFVKLLSGRLEAIEAASEED
ncbi:MAG: DsbA family protein [Gammaproteobacteria bacterium]|nr:DsbA family protein [Gammaproteobacteria bacterium]